ncbi:glutathione S-transferase family protein [Massilia horti]|uniref:Glutathione S-transferase family protein n=1 Tax=Massilia horti TaxID=2562153 RepID=A0A4Y9SYY1_9BURK|nr:glutathione S-transferase family protein [Massilia horti]TFW31970.1 glutathione S-transferase family protein [Massilia horti]
MRLYYHPMSSNSRRVTMAAMHLGLKLDLVETNLMSPDDRRRLAELNPNNKIPVLEDDGFLLWESAAIMQYLADCTPGQTLYPVDPTLRADVNRWLFWSCQHFSPAIGVIVWENLWKKAVHGTDPDQNELARGARDLEKFAGTLDGHLANREWLSGDAVSLADYAVAAPLMYKETARLPLDQYRHLLAWFGRVQQLDVWRRTDPVW